MNKHQLDLKHDAEIIIQETYLEKFMSYIGLC